MLFVFKNHIHKPTQLFFRKMRKPVFLVKKKKYDTKEC